MNQKWVWKKIGDSGLVEIRELIDSSINFWNPYQTTDFVSRSDCWLWLLILSNYRHLLFLFLFLFINGFEIIKRRMIRQDHVLWEIRKIMMQCLRKWRLPGHWMSVFTTSRRTDAGPRLPGFQISTGDFSIFGANLQFSSRRKKFRSRIFINCNIQRCPWCYRI